MGRRVDSHKKKKTKKTTIFAEPETNLYEEVKEEKKKSKSLGKKRIDREKGSRIEADEVDQYNVETEACNAEAAVREKNKSKLLRKKKRKNGRTEKSEIAQVDECCNEVDDGFEEQSAYAEGEIKDSKSRKKRRKNEKKNKVGIDKVAVLHKKGEEGYKGKKGRSKKTSNAQGDHPSPRKEEKSLEKRDPEQNEVYEISSGDEDCSIGMKKWITEYHQCRPGLKILQQRIDDFITDYEAKEEQARKEREALAAEGGWTVVVHHKGRKKTTDTETGITVGSVAQAAVLENMSKKKNKEVGVDFYRFQKREAQRNEIMALQSKFEQDKKRIQQMRAARKFRPY